jgi:hypothetical protein
MLGLWQSGDVMLYWNGNDWVKYLGAFPNGEVMAIASPASGQAWAVGWVPGRSRIGMVWHWTSRGWARAIDTRSLPFRAAQIMDARSIWAVGDDGLTAFWDGSAWTAVDNPTEQSLGAVYFLSPGDGWAGGEGGLIMHWNGAAWKVSQPYLWRPIVETNPFPHIEGFGFLASDNGWAVGRKDGEETILPLLTHWDGESWSEVDLGEAADICQCELTAMHFASAQDGWAVGGGEAALLAHWNGTQWTFSRGPDGIKLLTVGGPAANDLWAAGVIVHGDQTPYPGVILHYDGTTWKEFAKPDATWLDAFWMPASGEGWLAGNGILHWTGSLWGTVKSPVDSVVLAVGRTADGVLRGVTDNGVVLELRQH